MRAVGHAAGACAGVEDVLEFVELRHKVEIHNVTGRVVECPIDEMNRPRGRRVAALRIPPTAEQVGQLFAGWRGELATCRKFEPTARNFAAARLMSEVGLRINELRHTESLLMLDQNNQRRAVRDATKRLRDLGLPRR